MVVLRWPEDDARRRELAGRRTARLLLVRRGATPPRPLDGCEDWAFDDADATELSARLAQLAVRAGPEAAPARPVPVVEDGLLRVGDRWEAISAAQLPVVELLVREAGRVVTTAAIAQAYAAGGGSTAASSLKSLLHRLGRRFATVGLELRTVRGRGAVLHVPSAPRR